ncbi:MAG: cell division protein FtsL [Blastocatellia bacterium]|nr:cell division protein FtsL [Blastocatellia bacterium]
MYRYRLQSPIQNRRQRQTFDTRWLRQWGLVLSLGCLVACGFVFVTWQHVEAMRVGYETEQLKIQIQTLDQEHRQLLLERQRQLSPNVLEARARQQGLRLPNPKQTVVIQAQ